MNTAGEVEKFKRVHRDGSGALRQEVPTATAGMASGASEYERATASTGLGIWCKRSSCPSRAA